MKRIARIISSIVIVMVIGCNRESRSTRGPDAVAQKPKTLGAEKVSQTGRAMTGTAEWEHAFEERERQYKKMESFAKEVTTVCVGTNGEEAVDALLAKVSDLIDEYERSLWDKGNAMSSLTSFTAPFVRDVECYWTRRRFQPGETPPENLLNEVRLSHSLATKTVDLLQKKVGNSDVTAPLEIGNCSILKWLAHNFERAGWKEEKQYVDNMVVKWKETRYDLFEGNPLKIACEDVEIDAARNPNREKLPAAIYSRTKNKYQNMAVHVVGRLPKWFAAWAEEMERQDASVRSQSKNKDKAHDSSR